MLPLMLAALAQTVAPVVDPAPVMPEGTALTEAVLAADAAFFDTFFQHCDPVRVEAMVTPDFEMYHDKGGVVARDGATFVADYARQCSARLAPDAWRSRRAPVPETLHIDPVPGFGAIEEGEHLFYERRGDGPERLAGRARFVQLWRWSPEGWRLARVLSYAHRAAQTGGGE